MSRPEQSKPIERYATEVWSQGDLNAIVDEIFTPDRVRDGPDFEGTSEGAAGHKELVTLLVVQEAQSSSKRRPLAASAAAAGGCWHGDVD
jgi:hypothetical protein